MYSKIQIKIQINKVVVQKLLLFSPITVQHSRAVLWLADFLYYLQNGFLIWALLYYILWKLDTPARTLSISGLKCRVLKLSFLSLKMMVKSGLEFILKFIEPLQRYLLSCQANSAILGRYFCTGQQQLWKGSGNFKIKCLDHFLPQFLSKKW